MRFMATGWSEWCCSARARGDAGEDSDYDIAVFLKDLKEGDLDTRWRELDRLADLRSAILSDTEAFIDAKPYPAGAYRNRNRNGKGKPPQGRGLRVQTAVIGYCCGAGAGVIGWCG